MTATTLTSELDAVNLMLSVIGISPVSSLEVTGSADVVLAKQMLSEVSRTVQSRGWHFNTEEDYSLPADVDGAINLPTNTLHVDTDASSASLDLVQRGLKLYDREKHTYTISKEVKVKIIFLLGFDELPETARKFVSIAAARTFQRRMIGADKLDVLTEKEQQDAWLALLHAEGDSADSSMVDSYAVMRVLDRSADVGVPYTVLHASLK